MINIKFEGQEEIQKKIQEAMKLYRDETKKGVELSCITVEKKAKYYVPVDTGRLKASITYQVIDSLKDIIGEVGSNVEYAPYVELGTSRMDSQPFLLPALYESKKEILKIFEDVIKGIKL